MSEVNEVLEILSSMILEHLHLTNTEEAEESEGNRLP